MCFYLVIPVLNQNLHCLGDHSFTCAALKLWNALPFDIKSTGTVFFKAKLKTHLFRLAFLSHSVVVSIIVSLLLTVTLAF